MGNSDDAEGGEGADGARVQRAVSLHLLGRREAVF